MNSDPHAALLELAKNQLLRSNADKKHPFRFFWLASKGDFPEIRTVVLRKASPDLAIRFYTDSRSPKVRQIQADPAVSALFYHPKKMLQVRMRGKAILLDSQSPTYLELLQQIRHSPNLNDYTSSHAPGNPLGDTTEDEANGLIHFTVIDLYPEELDILLLSRAGHLRAHFARTGEGWKCTPLVP